MDKSIHSNDYKLMISLLKAARVDAGVSQEELALKMGVTQTFISKCERCERRLDLLETMRFCLGIGLNFSKFAHIIETSLANKKL